MKTIFASVFFLATFGMAIALTSSHVSAADGKGKVIRMGGCANSDAVWKLTANREHSTVIELESEIDQAHPGQHWTVKLTQNGGVFFNEKRRVDASGHINVLRMRPNTPGKDRFTLHAMGPSGQLCNGAIIF